MKRKILVVGGVAAGPSAASKAARTSQDFEVTLFEQGDHISYGVCELPYYISNTVAELDRLIIHTPERFEKEKGVVAKVRHRAESILPVQRRILVRNLETDEVSECSYDKLILATGARPRRLGIPSEDGTNVFRVKTLDDGIAIKKFMQQSQPKKAVIIGAGFIGMEMAEALRSFDIETTILHRSHLPMGRLEVAAREMILQELEKHGVRFATVKEIVSFGKDPSAQVKTVVTGSGTYPTDIVIVAVGFVPNSDLADGAGLQLGASGGIKVDQKQLTSVDNIYAAGDCCEIKNLVDNRPSLVPFATIAAKTGRVAGENAAGGNAIFRGTVRAVALKVFDLEIAQVGISSEEAQASRFDVATEMITDWSRISFMPGSKKLHIIYIIDKRSKRLLGANLIGEEGAALRANTLAAAIRHRLTVDEVSQLDLVYTPPFAPLWDPILVAANQAKKRLEEPKIKGRSG